MSDEYTIHGNFLRYGDDPRAAAEYAHRMKRVREREGELESLTQESLREPRQPAQSPP